LISHNFIFNIFRYFPYTPTYLNSNFVFASFFITHISLPHVTTIPFRYTDNKSINNEPMRFTTSLCLSIHPYVTTLELKTFINFTMRNLCKTYNINTFKFWLKSDKSNECNKMLAKIRQQYWTLYVKIYTIVLHAYSILH
jgi:hypothetical protein